MRIIYKQKTTNKKQDAIHNLKNGIQNNNYALGKQK